MKRLTEAQIASRYPKIDISPLREDEKFLIGRYVKFGPGYCYANALQLVFTLTTHPNAIFRDASARYVLAFGVGQNSIFAHGMVKRADRYIDATLDCDRNSAFYVVAEYAFDDILGDIRVVRTGSENSPAILPPSLHPDGTIGYGEILERTYGQWPR